MTIGLGKREMYVAVACVAISIAMINSPLPERILRRYASWHGLQRNVPAQFVGAIPGLVDRSVPPVDRGMPSKPCVFQADAAGGRGIGVPLEGAERREQIEAMLVDKKGS